MGIRLDERSEAIIAVVIDDQVDISLAAWAKWMRRPSHLQELSFPPVSPCFATGGINCWDDLEDSGEGYLATTMDSIVDSLELVQKSAIYNRYLASLFRGRAGTLEEALTAAVWEVKKKMLEKGLL